MTILATDGAGNRFVGKAEKKVGHTWIHSDTLMPQADEQIVDRIRNVGGAFTPSAITVGQGRTGFGGEYPWTPTGYPGTSGWWGFHYLYPFDTSNRMRIRSAIGTAVSINDAQPTSSVAQSAALLTYFGTVSGGDGKSIGIFRSQESGGVFSSIFIYAGRLVSLNPSSRYSAIRDSCIYMGVGDSSFTTNNTALCTIRYFRAGSVQGFTEVYKSGDALYSVQCAYGETPASLQVTDWIVFEPDPAEDYPYIGRVENLLLGYGAFQRGQVYYINPASQGLAMNGGSNYYIPVGRFGDRTILMRIGDPS
jgi:hypothetical protein